MSENLDLVTTKLGLESSAAHESLILALMRYSEDEIGFDIPKDASTQDLDLYMDVAVGAYGKMNNASFKLKPILARIIATIDSRPDMMEKLGATGPKARTKLCRDILPKKFQISGTECFRLLALGQQWPDLSVKEYKDIGPAKLRAIAKSRPRSKADGSISAKHLADRSYLIDIAPTMRYDKFVQFLESEGYADKDSVAVRYVQIPTDVAVFDRWREFVSDEDHVAVVGSNNMARFLDAMMAVCTVEWKAEAMARKSGN